MITQYNICFLILPLSWSKCLTSPYAILEIFLHDLMKNILNSEMTAAFLVARRGPGKFLLQKGDLIPFLFSFPTSLPSPLGFQTLLPVHLFPLVPHKFLSHLPAKPFPCWRSVHAGKAATSGFQPSALCL